MFDDFHFIRPELLFLIPVAIILLALWMKMKLANSQWQSIIPAHLHQRLVVSKGNKQSRQPYIWLMIALSIACVAAAGPAWEKLPQPVYQSDSGRVVVLDMSLSMRSTDVSPNRLTRAKFKAIDLVNEINDGEVGLIAYAGDAFTISPLTEDVSTLESLIPSLSPEIMPVSGSNPVSGLKQAMELLENAGYQNGHIYWITDGITLDDVKPLRDLVNGSPFEYSALLVGTEEGAPIQLNNGTLLKDSAGAIVIPKVNVRYLNQAFASSNAMVTQMSIDDNDIRSMIVTSTRIDQVRQNDEQQSTGDAWRDMGAYLVLLLLPISLLLFRKGLVFSVFIALLIPVGQNDALAQSTQAAETRVAGELEQTPDGSSTSENTVPSATMAERLFLNNDQRAKKAFEAGNYQGASQAFKDTKWRAASAYKAGDYETAAELYQQAEGLDSIYNRANALAKLGELNQALEEYQKVLDIDPSYTDAAKNKQIIEDLLDQQKKQQEQQQDQQQQQNQDNQQSEQGDSDSEQQEQSESDDQNQDQQNQDQNQQDSEQESQENQQESEDGSQGQEGSQQNQERQSEQQSEPQEQENGESEALEEGEQEQQEQSSEGNAADEQDASDEQQEQSAQVKAIDESQMTPEQREQMQRLQTLMNKVPDDPAFLLQRKMQLEAQKRKQFAPPAGQQQEW